MIQQSWPLRQAAPWVMSGVGGMHIMIRIWRVSRAPARELPLPDFLIAHSDVLMLLCGGPVVWAFARRHKLRNGWYSITAEPLSAPRLLWHTIHQLRQVFTALLLGLGLIKRKATAGTSADVVRLVERLKLVVAEGIQVLDSLDPPYNALEESAANGQE